MNHRIKYLQTLHTKKLIILLRESYKSNNFYKNQLKMGQEIEGYLTEEIKEVLNTREHVLNKNESLQKRQKKAKTKKDARNNNFIR